MTAVVDRRAPSVTAWSDHLDAAEEWCRRTRVLLDGPLDALPAALADVPDAPLPPGLVLRARVVAAELDRLAGLVARRRAAVVQAEAYSRF